MHQYTLYTVFTRLHYVHIYAVYSIYIFFLLTDNINKMKGHFKKVHFHIS